MVLPVCKFPAGPAQPRPPCFGPAPSPEPAGRRADWPEPGVAQHRSPTLTRSLQTPPPVVCGNGRSSSRSSSGGGGRRGRRTRGRRRQHSSSTPCRTCPEGSGTRVPSLVRALGALRSAAFQLSAFIGDRKSPTPAHLHSYIHTPRTTHSVFLSLTHSQRARQTSRVRERPGGREPKRREASASLGRWNQDAFASKLWRRQNPRPWQLLRWTLATFDWARRVSSHRGGGDNGPQTYTPA